MRSFLELGLADYLHFIYVVTASIVAITAYSLCTYALTFNFRSPVARQFSFLAVCVLLVFAIDVAVVRLDAEALAEPWLRVQWVGLSLLPAAYFRFATSVLQATHLEVRYRSAVGVAVLVGSILLAFGALFTDAVVRAPSGTEIFPHLQPGPLFWVFAFVFLLVLAHAIRDLLLARARSLTQASRLRNTFLLLGFIAPAMGSFPYLVAFDVGLGKVEVTVLEISILVNVGTAVLLSLMMLAVAYHGVRLPDRVVRYRLVRFAARGPFIAIVVLVSLQTIPTVEVVLGLPRDLVVFSVVTGVIVAGQLLLSLSRPLIDFLVYRGDAQEATWLRELERRLLTPSDIRRFMENHLISLCEFLRAPRGFVAAITGEHLVVEAATGMSDQPDEIMPPERWRQLLNNCLQRKGQQSSLPLATDYAGMSVWPLYGQGDPQSNFVLLGIIGVETDLSPRSFSVQETFILRSMQTKMAEALMDRRMQIDVLKGLRHIIPDIQKIQDMRGHMPYPGDLRERTTEKAFARLPDQEFTAWVRDALRDLWGGPRLTNSPLIRLKVVGRYLEKTHGNTNHALRLLLGDAIEGLRPSAEMGLGQLDSILYQILEMRFVQGRKVREIASKLAMSESDLYRKQRIAIEQVVTIIQEMEEAEQKSPREGPIETNAKRNEEQADSSNMKR